VGEEFILYQVEVEASGVKEPRMVRRTGRELEEQKAK
jgi:hypothetical protein